LKKEQEKIPENEEKKQSREISRRDFLVGAGTVVAGGAIGAGLLSGCGETVTTTVKEISTKISSDDYNSSCHHRYRNKDGSRSGR